MFRYLGVSWNVRDARQCETAQHLRSRVKASLPDLRPVLEVPGLAVYAGPDRRGSFETYPIAGQKGVVLGKLFHREMDEHEIPRQVTLDGASGAAIASSSGRHLLDRYWGQYVAFLQDEADCVTRVIRDPTGGLPCMVTSHERINVVFSRMQDCLSLGMQSFSVNWEYVRARLILPFLRGAQTALNEVGEVLAGECLEFRGDARPRRQFYWNPMRIAASDVIEDLEVAAREARATARACVGAWASGYPRIVLKLSGGIDSSIVLACLRHAPSRPSLTCLNYFERSVWGDERRFARLAVQGAGPQPVEPCKLIEYERRAADVQLRALMNVTPSARPRSYLTSHEQRRIDIPVADQERAPLFTGTHGDGVFLTKKTFSAVDYVYRHGIGPGLLSATHATARWQGVAAWKLLPRVIHAGLRARHRPFEPLEDMRTARERRFVDAAVMQEFEKTGPSYLTPPWLDADARIPPGKMRHCDLMYLATSNTNPLEHAEDPDWIMPLASQPLVELFLRIPTYVLTAGGRDRMVARRAFENELPPEILSRRTKVTGNNLILDIFRHNRALYRETLLDGVLVEERLLDRQKVENFFASVDDPGTKGLGELLLSHFHLELWLRSWKRSARDTAGDVAA